MSECLPEDGNMDTSSGHFLNTPISTLARRMWPVCCVEARLNSKMSFHLRQGNPIKSVPGFI